jgi:hypothetical protein
LAVRKPAGAIPLDRRVFYDMPADRYGILSNLLVPIFETDLRRRIKSQTNLVAYVERMTVRFFT